MPNLKSGRLAIFVSGGSMLSPFRTTTSAQNSYSGGYDGHSKLSFAEDE